MHVHREFDVAPPLPYAQLRNCTLISKQTWSNVALTKTALTQPLTTFIWTSECILTYAQLSKPMTGFLGQLCAVLQEKAWTRFCEFAPIILSFLAKTYSLEVFNGLFNQMRLGLTNFRRREDERSIFLTSVSATRLDA